VLINADADADAGADDDRPRQRLCLCEECSIAVWSCPPRTIITQCTPTDLFCLPLIDSGDATTTATSTPNAICLSPARACPLSSNPIEKPSALRRIERPDHRHKRAFSAKEKSEGRSKRHPLPARQ